MHPHVLALPFVLLALALSFSVLAQKQRISWPQLGLMTICFGGLAFLNLSDWPIYFFILISVLAMRWVRDEKPQSWRDWLRPAFGFGMPLAGVLAYLPWHLSYRSQIGGILPNPIFATRFHQLFVMFGPFLVIIAWFLVDLAIRQRARFAWLEGIALGAGLLILLFGLMIGLGFITVQSSDIARLFLFSSTGASVAAGTADSALQSQIGQSMWAVIRHRLLGYPGTPLVLTLIIIGALAYLLPLFQRKEETEGDEPANPPENASSFVVLLILVGALLILGPEFLYIRDVFGMRLNTVFKFYYAAWLIWAIASACALHMVLGRPRNGIHRVTQIVFLGVSILLITAGLVYPSFAIPTKAGDFAQAADRQPTLDGIEFIRHQYPSDHTGILWLQKNVEPGSVVLEAVGGSYSYYARVSAATGLPTVIGWPGHENQWRGSLFEELAEGREGAVKEIYATTSITRAQQLLDEHGVDYVFVGSLERNPEYASEASLEKFSQFLTLVFQDGDVDIYRVDKPLIKERP
jgi:YYY domain-containing protein